MSEEPEVVHAHGYNYYKAADGEIRCYRYKRRYTRSRKIKDITDADVETVLRKVAGGTSLKTAVKEAKLAYEPFIRQLILWASARIGGNNHVGGPPCL